MATVNQTITLTVELVEPFLAINGTVFLTRSPTSQRVPPYPFQMQIHAPTLKYMWLGVAVGDVNPLILSGPGEDTFPLLVADVATMTAAGVFNL